ncbi:hypothetical protein [Alloyangia pacifica]|uniref:head-tail joining protein n=1 Tax=Alloyangia pacifica TaxID=311180 RepID=UPI001CFDA4FE|nr:hypothetical protein [Alloyangia pacifica]
MTSVFAGMTGILDAVLGDSVTVQPKGGAERAEQAVFREGPVLVLGRDGQEVTTVLPTLSGDRLKLQDLMRGSTVKPGNGKTYRVLSSMPSGSPADDARLTLKLEMISASA